MLSRGEAEGVVTRFAIHSIEAASKPDALRQFLSNIDRSLGLSVYDTDTAEEREVASLVQRSALGFDDAMQYYVAKKLGAEAIVSFDKHFDKLDVPRVEPADLRL
jgi:predicted nucleic acid-binding protein